MTLEGHGLTIIEFTDYTVPAMEVEIPEARKTFETNFFAVITMCQTFLPLLIKAKGTIVQIGSIAGVSSIIGPEIRADTTDIYTDYSRSFPTSLDRYTTRPKRHCIPSVIRSGLNWLPLGECKVHGAPYPLYPHCPLLTRWQCQCNYNRYRRSPITYCSNSTYPRPRIYVYPH